MACCTAVAWFPCHAFMPWFQPCPGQCGCHGIVTQTWHHCIMAWVWHCGIMAWVWVCSVVSQYPSYCHTSSMRFHWPWAHTNCLSDLIVLVSTLQTHSSLMSPQCAPSPWPDTSGAKKMQWVQRYVQKSCMNMFLFMVHSLPPFGCLDLQDS